MRRSRRASHDSSQDSPVTDNERDILWGDSPPARRLCLSVTPGKRMTRSVAAEQDLTDLIECVHPKENKESNTPPLLGLWMRNRGEPGSGKKKLKTARLTRRTTGRKLSRVGLDSLKVLSEWTGNLAAAIEESAAAAVINDEPGSSTSGPVVPEGSVDEHQEDVPFDDLQDLWSDEGVGDGEYVPGEKQRQSDGKQDGKRRSSNLSLTDDLWGNDDWCDDDSVIRIATQVENEALTQVKKETEERASSVADVISPTQRGNNLLGNTRPPQESLKNKTCVPHVSGKGQTSNKGVMASRFAPKTSERIASAAKFPVHDSSVCPSQKTSQHFHGLGSVVSQPSSVLLNKPVYASQSNSGGYSVQSNVKTVSKIASSVQSSSSSSFHGSISSMGVPKPIGVKNNSSYRSWKKPSAQNRTITRAHSTPLPEAVKNRENTARVPAIPDIISHISQPSTSSKGIDDSLDDLFGDSSLPDDMLLELLDNDSDFEEYTKKPVIGQVAGTVGAWCTMYPSEKTLQTRQPGLGAGKATASKTSGAPVPRMSSNQPAHETVRLPHGSQSSHVHVAPKQSVSRGSCRNDSKALTSRMPPQSTVSHSSMATRSSARIATLSTAGASVNQSSAMFSHNSGDKCEQGRKSLSQPTTPMAKKGGDMVHRFCSQQEIEKKRQEAIAKRKKRKLNVTAVS